MLSGNEGTVGQCRSWNAAGAKIVYAHLQRENETPIVASPDTPSGVRSVLKKVYEKTQIDANNFF